MKYPKRSQYQHAKSQYRVRNWPEYEAGLKKRGDLTVWLSDDALEAWRVPAEGKPGGQRTYSDVAIEAALTIRMVFHLPLRQTEGFLRSLAQLLKVDLPIPDHTTLSRRLTKLSGVRFRSLPLSPDSLCRGLARSINHSAAPVLHQDQPRLPTAHPLLPHSGSDGAGGDTQQRGTPHPHSTHHLSLHRPDNMPSALRRRIPIRRSRRTSHAAPETAPRPTSGGAHGPSARGLADTEPYLRWLRAPNRRRPAVRRSTGRALDRSE